MEAAQAKGIGPRRCLRTASALPCADVGVDVHEYAWSSGESILAIRNTGGSACQYGPTLCNSGAVADAGARGRGRPPAASREDVERVAMRLFLTHGYAATTIPMIAADSGVSRTSVIRYWGTKSEIVWAEFDRHIERLAAALAEADHGRPVMVAVCEAVIENLGASIAASPAWLDRFAVLDAAPELRAEEAEHWVRWADVIASYVASRSGQAPNGLAPQAVGGAVQGAFLAFLRQWRDGQLVGDPLPALHRALEPICTVLDGLLPGIE